jgi:hypothetical protein
VIQLVLPTNKHTHKAATQTRTQQRATATQGSSLNAATHSKQHAT